MSRVREAFVTSVTCTAFSGSRAPPVRFQISQVSIVPASNSPASARSRAPSTLSRIHAHFGPAGYELYKRPVRAKYTSCVVPASGFGLVRVSCHTIARWIGTPVALSQITAVSRWLVRPRAAMSSSAMSASAIASLSARRVLRQISSASCSTHPSRGRCWVCSNCAWATTLPRVSVNTTRVEVVPWSMAAMRDMPPIVWGRLRLEPVLQHLCHPVLLVGGGDIVRSVQQCGRGIRHGHAHPGPGEHL